MDGGWDAGYQAGVQAAVDAQQLIQEAVGVGPEVEFEDLLKLIAEQRELAAAGVERVVYHPTEEGEAAVECMHSLRLALGLQPEVPASTVLDAVVSLRRRHAPPSVEREAPLRAVAVETTMRMLRRLDKAPALDEVVILAEYLRTGSVQDVVTAVESRVRYLPPVDPLVVEAEWAPGPDEERE